MKLRDLYTGELSKTTAKMPVKDSSGKDTGHTFDVTTNETDAFHAAIMQHYQSSKGSPANSVDVICSLITGWSFDEDFNAVNLHDAVTNMPYIRVPVFNFAADHTSKIFAKKKPISTTAKPKES